VVKREVRPLRELVEKSSEQDSQEWEQQRDKNDWAGVGVDADKCCEYLDYRLARVG